MTARVTVNDVERVAELANLELTAEETGAMQRDLNAILDYAAELNELDTAGVEPLAQVSELLSEGGDGGATAVDNSGLRADVVVPSLDRGTVMAQATETDGVFFKVPRVMERQ